MRRRGRLRQHLRRQHWPDRTRQWTRRRDGGMPWERLHCGPGRRRRGKQRGRDRFRLGRRRRGRRSWRGRVRGCRGSGWYRSRGFRGDGGRNRNVRLWGDRRGRGVDRRCRVGHRCRRAGGDGLLRRCRRRSWLWCRRRKQRRRHGPWFVRRCCRTLLTRFARCGCRRVVDRDGFRRGRGGRLCACAAIRIFVIDIVGCVAARCVHVAAVGVLAAATTAPSAPALAGGRGGAITVGGRGLGIGLARLGGGDLFDRVVAGRRRNGLRCRGTRFRCLRSAASKLGAWRFRLLRTHVIDRCGVGGSRGRALWCLTRGALRFVCARFAGFRGRLLAARWLRVLLARAAAIAVTLAVAVVAIATAVV